MMGWMMIGRTMALYQNSMLIIINSVNIIRKQYCSKLAIPLKITIYITQRLKLLINNTNEIDEMPLQSSAYSRIIFLH